MHIFSPSTLQRFLDAMGEIYTVESAAVPTTVVSRATLPKQPTMLVLPGR